MEFAATLPGIAALFVGGLYGAGAVLWGAKLRDAGLIVRDTLPLVPLPQLLALGINTAVTLGAALALAAVAFFAGTYRTERDPPIWLPPRAKRRLSRRSSPSPLFIVALIAAVVSAFTLTAITAAWWVFVGSALTLAIGFFGGSKSISSGRPRYYAALSAAIAFVTLVIALGAVSIAFPDPLPRATVDTHSGPALSGRLITATDQAVYLGRADRRYSVIPARQVRALRVRSLETKVQPSVFELITGYECLEIVVQLCRPQP